MDLAQLTYEAAKAFEGTAFTIDLPDGTSVQVRLDEVLQYESRERRRSRVPRKREPFSLYFVGPANPVLPQAMYTFRSDAVTFKQVFIVPIGRDDESTEYEAVFA